VVKSGQIVGKYGCGLLGAKMKGRRKENKKREFSGKRERLFFFKKMIKP